MNRITQRIFIGLAMMLLFGLATAAVSDLQRLSEPQQRQPVRPLKLNAAGQIDLTTGAIMFGGVATHFGLYTANGFLNPDFSIVGTFKVANGDTLNFTALFSTGPLGDIRATFDIAGGTGRFAEAVGTASGPVTLNPDLTFFISAIGHLAY